MIQDAVPKMSGIEILLCRCLIPYLCHEMRQGFFSHSCNSFYLTEIRSIMSPHRDMFTVPSTGCDNIQKANYERCVNRDAR